MFDPVVQQPPPDLASRIVWFDAYVSNVDRTVRNTNMLMWHRRLFLIDHGASLYFHHSPGSAAEPQRASEPFALIKQHVLLARATMLEQVDAEMAGALTDASINDIVELIPDGWLAERADRAWDRHAYSGYLRERLKSPRAFVREAVRAR
jgi:hypothetical protein